jgi:tripartite ATP-independent transporter DctP family solute receptor
MCARPSPGISDRASREAVNRTTSGEPRTQNGECRTQNAEPGTEKTSSSRPSASDGGRTVRALLDILRCLVDALSAARLSLNHQVAIAVVVAAVLLTGCAGSAPVATRWAVKLSHVYAASSDYQKMALRFRDLMRERTGGRFDVIIYPSGQLGDERISFEQLRFGAQQMAISGTPVLSGWVPEGQIFDLPFLFASTEQGVAALTGTLGDWWRALLLEKTGVRSLGFLEYGFRHVYNRTRPIRTPADLRGLKLRVLQNTTYLRAYDALGVQATPMAYGEVYSALQQGVIDGGEANVIGYVTDRFYEVAPYFSLTAVTYNPITLLINEPFYQSLPADVRAALERSAAEALEYQRGIALQMTADALAQMKSAGVSIAAPDTALFAAVVRPLIWNELAARLLHGDRLLEWLQRETAPRQATAGLPVAAIGPRPPLVPRP